MKFSEKALLVAIVLVLVFVTACSKKSSDGGTASSSTTPQASSSSSASSGTASSGSATDINAKYDPPITVTAVRDQDPSMAFKEGEDFDNNSWTKAYLDELGIKLKYDWIVPSDQYVAKLNVAIASGNLPDIFVVNGSQFKQLTDAGLLADLTDAYETYASELTRNSIELGPLAKAAASVNGRLMGIPQDETGYEGELSLLWIRSDWLAKFNLPVPKTWDELEAVMDAFVNKDPDGNGKKDTYGIALNKDLFGGVADLTGFFNAFGAFPNLWIKGADGKLQYGSIQPEVRTALEKLQGMYKKGWIDPEFGVKDGGKVGEDFANNRIGVNYGALWNSLWPLQDSVTKNPEANWIVTMGVSATGSPAQYTAKLRFDQFTVVNKNAKNPEALIKLLNIGNEKLYSGTADAKVYHTEIVGDKEYGHFKEHLVQIMGTNPIGGNFGHYKKVTAALDSKDPTGLNPEQRGYYDKIVAFNGGDRTTWGTMRVFGHESSYSTIEKIYEKKDQNLMYNEYYAAPTKTMAARSSTLDKMQLDTFTNIILGQPIETFDEFVANWKKLGGDDITAEVNEWYAAK